MGTHIERLQTPTSSRPSWKGTDTHPVTKPPENRRIRAKRRDWREGTYKAGMPCFNCRKAKRRCEREGDQVCTYVWILSSVRGNACLYVPGIVPPGTYYASHPSGHFKAIEPTCPRTRSQTPVSLTEKSSVNSYKRPA